MSNGAHGVFRKQFYKTEMCRYYRGGCVKGSSCSYAHGEEELRVAPELAKTSLCQAWMKHSCPLSSKDCQFAHGWAEMRATPAFMEYGAHQSATKKKKGQHRSPEGVDARPEVPGEAPRAPPVSAEGTTVASPPPLSPDHRHAAKPGVGRAHLAPKVPAATKAPLARAEDMLGVAIALPAWALPPQLGQVLMFQPAVAAGSSMGVLQRPQGMELPAAGVPAGVGAEVLQQALGAVLPGQGEALTQALLQGLRDRVEMDLPEALGAAHSRALASALQQAMPDYYED